MRLLLAWNKIEPSASRLRYIAQVYQKQGDISNTESYYRQSLDIETDPSKQAKVYLTLAKIAYASKKDFPEARRLAQKAAQLQAGWGAPYMLIGNLYASSASKVSDGVNGRTVYYAAVDMFRKAKDIDPNVSSEADAKIGKWSGQYPTQDDKNGYFMSKGKAFPAVGSGITVGGWIGQRTTVK
jgi:tetratricopeptide (TPR) repeat protein